MKITVKAPSTGGEYILTHVEGNGKPTIYKLNKTDLIAHLKKHDYLKFMIEYVMKTKVLARPRGSKKSRSKGKKSRSKGKSKKSKSKSKRSTKAKKSRRSKKSKRSKSTGGAGKKRRRKSTASKKTSSKSKKSKKTRSKSKSKGKRRSKGGCFGNDAPMAR